MSMETCTEHDDTVVVYDAHGQRYDRCPLCKAEEKIGEHETTIEERDDRIKDLEGEVKDLTAKVERATSGE